LTSDQRKLERLTQQNYDHLKLQKFAETGVSKTRSAAEQIYGDKWNYYSDALRREVVYSFQSSIECLRHSFDKIDYLEIGSAQGMSMSVIGVMLQETGVIGDLVSVDPYFQDGYIEGAGSPFSNVQKIEINKKARDKALSLYKSLKLNVELLEMKSSDGLKRLLNEDRKFHLIYIDGSHEGLNPVIDFGLSYELLQPNCIIMLDDHSWNDVRGLKSLCDKHCEKVDECWKVAAYRVHK